MLFTDPLGKPRRNQLGPGRGHRILPWVQRGAQGLLCCFSERGFAERWASSSPGPAHSCIRRNERTPKGACKGPPGGKEVRGPGFSRLINNPVGDRRCPAGLGSNPSFASN